MRRGFLGVLILFFVLMIIAWQSGSEQPPPTGLTESTRATMQVECVDTGFFDDECRSLVEAFDQLALECGLSDDATLTMLRSLLTGDADGLLLEFRLADRKSNCDSLGP